MERKMRSSSPVSGTKSTIVSDLSKNRRKNICNNKEGRREGSITTGSMKNRTETEANVSSDVRKTYRHVRLKKYENYVYGNTKVTACKPRSKSADVSTSKNVKKLKDKYMDKEVELVYNDKSKSITKEKSEVTETRRVEKSEICTRGNLKRKLKDGEVFKDTANEIVAKKDFKNTRGNICNIKKGKYAKTEEKHTENESIINEGIVAEKKNILYIRTTRKNKAQKQNLGIKMVTMIKRKTSEESGNMDTSDISPSGVQALKGAEHDEVKTKGERKADMTGNIRIFKKEAKEQNIVQIDGKAEDSEKCETRTRSVRKVMKKVDEDFEYYKTENNSENSTINEVKENEEETKEVLNSGSEEEHLFESGDTVSDGSLSDSLETDVCGEVQHSDLEVKMKDNECTLCDISFSGEEKYAEHIRNEHITFVIPCAHCSTLFETKTEMLQHLKETHTDFNVNESMPNRLKCRYKHCPMEFQTEDYLQRHVNTDHLKIRYECQFCGVRFEQAGCLKMHWQVQHPDKLPTKKLDECAVEKNTSYVCPYKECLKKFNNMSNRKKHINAVHLQIRNFPCEICEYRFKTSTSLKLHIAARHSTDDAAKQYKCDVCSKTFLRKAGLQLHESVHTNNEKPYTCSFEGCEKTCRLKSNMTKHEKTHYDVRPYQCEVCEEKFSRKTYLETHMYKHTGVKAYSCDICQKSFTQKGNLMSHKLLHDRERTIYKCPKCSQAFNFKSNMKKHLERHDLQFDGDCFESTVCEEKGSKKTGNSKPFLNSPEIRSGSVQSTSKALGSNVSTTNMKDNLEAFKNNKILISPNVLGTFQKCAKPVVIVVRPDTSPLIIQRKAVEAAGNGAAERSLNKVISEDDKDAYSQATVLMSTQQSSTAFSVCQARYKSPGDSLVDKTDQISRNQEEVAIPDNIPCLNFRKEQESLIQSDNNPVYVCIEDVTNQVLNKPKSVSTGENAGITYTKSVAEPHILKNKNPTFMIEYDSNGMPIARLRETASDSSSGTEKTVSENTGPDQIVDDIVSKTHKTNGNSETSNKSVLQDDAVHQIFDESSYKVIETRKVEADNIVQQTMAESPDMVKKTSSKLAVNVETSSKLVLPDGTVQQTLAETSDKMIETSSQSILLDDTVTVQRSLAETSDKMKEISVELVADDEQQPLANNIDKLIETVNISSVPSVDLETAVVKATVEDSFGMH